MGKTTASRLRCVSTNQPIEEDLTPISSWISDSYDSRTIKHLFHVFMRIPHMVVGDVNGISFGMNLIMTSRRDVTGMIRRLQGIIPKWANNLQPFSGWIGSAISWLMLGIIVPTDFHIFQRGRSTNHQPVYVGFGNLMLIDSNIVETTNQYSSWNQPVYVGWFQ